MTHFVDLLSTIFWAIVVFWFDLYHVQIWKQVLIGIRTRFLTTWGRLANLVAFRRTLVLVGDDLLWCRLTWAHTTCLIFWIVLLTIIIKINTEPPIFFHINSEIWQFMLSNATPRFFFRGLIIGFTYQIINIPSSLPHLILKLDISHICIGLRAVVASSFLSLFLFLYFNYLLIWHNNFKYTWIKHRFFMLFWLLASGCNFRGLVAVRIIEARYCVFASNRVKIVIFVLRVHYNILIRCCWNNWDHCFFELIIFRSRGFVAASFVFAFFLIIFYLCELVLQSLFINYIILFFFKFDFGCSSA